jgi:hypothetical protein
MSDDSLLFSETGSTGWSTDGSMAPELMLPDSPAPEPEQQKPSGQGLRCRPLTADSLASASLPPDLLILQVRAAGWGGRAAGRPRSPARRPELGVHPRGVQPAALRTWLWDAAWGGLARHSPKGASTRCQQAAEAAEAGAESAAGLSRRPLQRPLLPAPPPPPLGPLLCRMTRTASRGSSAACAASSGSAC